MKAKTALLVVYSTENANKALMIVGRNLSINHIKRHHIKSVYLINFLMLTFTDTHVFASFYTLNDI